MEALLAYASSGSESDEPGEQASAEQRLFDLGGGEGGLLTFVACCPPWTKLKIPRKDVLAADLEGAHFDGGSFLLFPAPPDESEIEFHLITRGPFGARVGTRDAHGKFSIDDETDHTWLSPTFTACADPTFSNGDVVGLLSLTFAAATGVFICQDQPGVWVVCDAADFMDLAKPSVCVFSQIQDEDHHSLCLPTSVCAALDVQLCMADDADDQWDNPQVAESDAESEVSAEVAVPTVMADFRTGRNGKLEGRFEGSGQKLGTWDVFTAFWSEESSKLMTFWAGLQVVTPGAQHSAILVRILGGKKTGGVRGSEQACYICLLYKLSNKLNCVSGSRWLYATMPNITAVLDANADTPTFLKASEAMMSQIEKEFESFTPATVSGAIQQAANAIPAASKPSRKRKTD